MRLSAAAPVVWGVAGVAVVLAVWHGWGILVTPERSFFWFMTFVDLVVAGVAFSVGRQWPRYADVESGGIVLLRQRIRFEAITEIRLGDVSAKPFWLAFWLPTSLVVGVIAALIPASSYNREVVEFATANGRARLRWRKSAGHDEVVNAVRAARPDLEPRYGLDGRSPARDFSPRMSVGGGLLCACLLLWAFFAGWSGLQLLDRSTQEGPNALAATSSALRSVTSDLTGYEPVPGARVGYHSWRCDRVNDLLLGPSPDVVDLHLEIDGKDVPPATADAIEARIRKDVGMDPDQYLFAVDRRSSDVAIDIPVMSGLHVDVSTGCVDSDDLPALQGQLDELAKAVGAGR